MSPPVVRGIDYLSRPVVAEVVVNPSVIAEIEVIVVCLDVGTNVLRPKSFSVAAEVVVLDAYIV